MTDWFEWNGVRSTEYGIHVDEHPPITFPAERSTFTEIPGRSGTLTVLEGDAVYDDLQLTCKCFIDNTDRIDEIAAWLRGRGTVTFANRRGGFYDARVVNQISFEQILRGRPQRSFAVVFRCKPFFYLEITPTTLSAPGSITNPTGFDAYPIITIHGNGDKQSVMIGSYSLLIDNLTDNITIDCENMLAFNDKGNMSKHITVVDDDWPILVPGTNMVNWTAGITTVEITSNWRTL